MPPFQPSHAWSLERRSKPNARWLMATTSRPCSRLYVYRFRLDTIERCTNRAETVLNHCRARSGRTEPNNIAQWPPRHHQRPVYSERSSRLTASSIRSVWQHDRERAIRDTHQCRALAPSITSVGAVTERTSPPSYRSVRARALINLVLEARWVSGGADASDAAHDRGCRDAFENGPRATRRSRERVP